jgi:uncharacterized protein with NAD-binding domain and iron-sulfur cluster
MAQSGSTNRRKIAVLGGGVGAMSAAFHLTEQPGWQDRYEISVYQMGWRLGGKGASGRNAAFAQRIEEHGLHIWFGFYDNAFALMQKAYAELGRPADAPLATWQDAFKPQQFIALTERVANQWKVWPIETPAKPGLPGEGSEEVTLLDIVATLRAWIRQWVRDLDAKLCGPLADSAAWRSADALLGLHNGSGTVHEVAVSLRHEVQEITALIGGAAAKIEETIVDVGAKLPAVFDLGDKETRSIFVTALRAMQDDLLQRVEPHLDIDDEARRIFVAIDLAVVSLIGMVEDGVLLRGFDAINDIEFRAWLRKHGASEKYTVDSAPVVSFYDLVFAYIDGDFSKPNIEAGTMLRGILRIALCYHGAITWKMQAGMGDTVFTPLYQILRRRGVKFNFFSKVEELIPDVDGVGEIVITEQCSLADGAAEYFPLVKVKQLDCWPSTPNYAQLDSDQAELLRRFGVNLESHWSDWPKIYAEHFGAQLPEKRLKRGEDFDEIVFGLSIGSVPHVCPKLLEKSPGLQGAVDNVRTVATQSYQVWLGLSVDDLGWKSFGAKHEEPVVSGFTEPFDTWAPMDQLLCREDWPGGQTPQNVSYFCSAMPVTNFPPPSATGFPADCAQAVKQSALDQLQHDVYNLWPTVATPNSLSWPTLVDPRNASGPARFDAQFWRANIDPSERYVLSVVGSTKYRLRSEASGLSNLYLAGDWLKTGLNAGCVEAAVMGGMQASRAICGYPAVIRGEHDG